MKQKNLIILAAAVVVIVALLFGASQMAKPKTTYWPGTDIVCLPNGHANLSLHIHPTLTVSVNGVPIPIKGGIGISATCMSEVHTHEEGGVIHIESVEVGKTYTIKDFYKVSGETLEQEGFTLSASVNGASEENVAEYQLKDGDVVELTYTGIPTEE